MDLLDLLAGFPNGLTLAELCKSLELPKSTVHRILNALIERDYVREAPEKGRYLLGYQVVRIAQSGIEGINLLREARPILLELNKQLDETVILAVLDPARTNVVYLDKIDTTQKLRLISHIGETAPIHCTALGKALLSGFDIQEVTALLSSYSFDPFTKNTLGSLEALIADVQVAKQTGYALDVQEYREKAICIAAPVVNCDGRPLAAISVSAPIDRLDGQRRDQVAQCVVDSARRISSLVQFLPSSMG